MNIELILRKIYHKIFDKAPIVVNVNISKLAPSEYHTGGAILITGGTSGIGFAIADAMLSANAAAVVITGRSEKKCQSAVRILQQSHPEYDNRIFYQVLDNRNVSSYNRAFKEICEKIKVVDASLKINVLINNAGVQGAVFGSAKEEDYDNVLDTNAKGVFFLSQLVAHYMIDNNIKGNILNICSSSSLRPVGGAYTLSKVAVKEMTEGMAKSLISHGIVVNGLAPGPTATPMMHRSSESDYSCNYNPLGRYALPEEIANMAVILTSNLGRTIVGSVVYMTGGSGNLTLEDVKYDF